MTQPPSDETYPPIEDRLPRSWTDQGGAGRPETDDTDSLAIAPPSYPPPAYGVAAPLPASVTEPPPSPRPGGVIGVPPQQAPAPARTMSEPAPMPIPGPRNGLASHTVRIGLWGSARSGKSTFLAALPVAAMQGEHGTWVVAGTDGFATDYLNESVNGLVSQRMFPRPNRVIEPISWSFHGTPPATGWGRNLLSKVRRQPAGPVEFTLELHDPPGAFFQTGRISEEAIDHLANAHGLIYLVDPVMSAADGEMNFSHFFGALQRLTGRMANSGQLLNGRLPHYIAVCVTKLDDDRFFRQVVGAELVTQDQHGARLPRVPQQRAAEFFGWVCTRVLGGNALMVRDALRAHFHEDRIEYFATSAIGFRLNSNHMFDFRDFDNQGRNGETPFVRDLPRPINVIEPLVYLERRIRAEQRT